MKVKYFFVLFALFFSALMIHSCEKETTGSTDFPKENSLIKKDATGKEIHVSCEGTCTEGCGMINKNGMGGFQCGPCGDDCSLVVQIYYLTELTDTYYGDEADTYLTTVMEDRDYFEENLEDFVLAKYDTEDFHITKAEMVVESQGHGIKYTFRTAGGIQETVIFLQERAGHEPGTVYKIDCYGTCNGSCIERWMLTDPPSADCTCQGDNCGMQISMEN